MTATDLQSSAPVCSQTSLPEAEQRFIRWAILMACLIATCTITIADPDLWGHTLYGLRSLQQGILTETTDPFSYTAQEASWVNHEWLAEYQFGWLWSRVGNPGLILWRNLLVLTVFVIGWLSLKSANASLPATVLLLAFAAECLSNFVVFVRPQLMTFALFAITLFVLNRHWNNPKTKSLWWLPLIMLVWVNSHGGFLAGLGVMSVYAAGWCWRGWKSPAERKSALLFCGCAVSCGLLTFVNPYGYQLHLMLLHHLGTEQFVREWQPLWQARQSPGYYVPFILLLVALPGIRRWKLIDAIVLGVVAFQAVSHIRHIALLMIAVLVLLPGPITAGLNRLFPQLLEQWSSRKFRPVRLAGTMAVVAFLAVVPLRENATIWEAGVPPWEIAVRTDQDVPGMPLRAISWMQSANLQGNLVTDYGWAQCVIWHLYPQNRVAFDGRYRTVYSAELEREFLAFQHTARDLPERTHFLDEVPTDFVLLPVNRGPVKYLDQRRDWVRVFADEQANLYVRNSPAHQQWIKHIATTTNTLPTVPQWDCFPGLARSGTPLASQQISVAEIPR